METDLILLDGGMGTQLQAAGLPVGQLPELWNLTEPEKITAVHRRYVEAGSRVLYTNTFGFRLVKKIYRPLLVAWTAKGIEEQEKEPLVKMPELQL